MWENAEIQYENASNKLMKENLQSQGGWIALLVVARDGSSQEKKPTLVCL
jgi:hypothetical protein